MKAFRWSPALEVWFKSKSRDELPCVQTKLDTQKSTDVREMDTCSEVPDLHTPDPGPSAILYGIRPFLLP